MAKVQINIPLGSSIVGVHNSLPGLQGGTTTERYHLSLSEYNNIGKTFAILIETENIIQDDRLIGLDTTNIDFPFSIAADNVHWTNFTNTEIFPDLNYDSITGTITGFTIQANKLITITTL